MKRLLALLFLFVPLAAGEPSEQRIRGVILDPDGNALSNARVLLRSANSSCVIVPGRSFTTTVTDGAGAFSLPRPDEPMEIQIEHPEYGTAWARAEEGGIVRMRRGATLAGRLSAPCRLTVTHKIRQLSATDAAGGSFRLEALPPGTELTIAAISDRHRPYVRTLTLGEGERRNLDITLDEGLALTGRVIPAQAGIVVRASQGEARESKDTTDEFGNFRLTGLREGAVCLVVLAPGRDPAVVYGKAAEHLDVRLPR